MEDERLTDTLNYLRVEVSKISIAVVKLAEQEQKIVHIMERQDRNERDISKIQDVLTGPEGILVKMERNAVKLAMGCTIGAGAVAILINYIMDHMVG